MHLFDLIHPRFLYDADDANLGGAQPVADTLANTTPPAQTTTATPPPPSVDWEKRYKGQQQFAQSLQSQLNKFQQEHHAVITDYEGKVTTLQTERDSVLNEKKSLETAKVSLQQENLSIKKQLAVMQKIHDPERPELQRLAPFFAKGLLAVGDLEGEALDKYLLDYASTLGAQLEGQVRATVSGASPTSPAGTRTQAGKTADDLYSELMQMDPSDPNYGQLKADYLAQFNRERNA